MGAAINSAGGSGAPVPAPPPKILLAKPGGGTGGSIVKIGRGDDEPYARSRLPHVSLNFVSDSWEVHPDRLLPFMSESNEFIVIGIIGPPGVGKSTILNELYGYDGSTTGMLPPFPIETEGMRAMARHCTVGIELRITSERLILLDNQPVFSPSVLAEMMRPDGSSAVSVLTGESLPAEMAHELMNIQVLTMRGKPFGKPMSERDWLRNSARIWERVKKSPVVADYSKLLLNSGMFRK